MPDDVLDEIFKTPGTPAPTRRTGSAADSIKRIFDEEGANSSLGLAMARQEGGKWDTRTSGAGAQGPLQVIPATGLRYVKPEEWATPEGKIRASARYIKELSAQFGDDPYYITAAYHAGEGKVKSYYEKGQPIPRAPEFYDKHANIYTPDHVDRVMSNLQGQGKRSIYGNKSVLDDIFSQQPPPPAQDNSGIAVGHQQSQPPAAPPQQTYAPGLGPWPEKDAKGKPYKPLTPEMAAWQAEGRANTDREMALRDVAVGHKQDPFEGVAVGHNQNYVPPPATPATWLETGKATLKEGGARLLRTFGNLAIPSDIPYDRMTPAEKLVRDKQRDYGQESQAVYQRSSLPQKITQKVGSGVIGAVPPVVATMAGVPAPLAFGANTTAENLDLGAERAVTEGLKAGLTVGLMQKAQPLITPLSEGIKASIASRLVAGGLVGTGAAAMQVVDDVFSTGQPDYERAAHYGIPAAIITALLPGAGGQVRMGEYVGNVNDGAPPSTAMTRSNVVEEGYQGAPGAPLRRNNALPPGIRPQGVSPFEPPLAEPPSPRPPVAPSPGSPSGPRLLPPGGGAPRPAIEPPAPAAELPSNPLWAGDEVGINGTTVKITSADSMVVRGIDTASGQPRFWPKQVFEKMAGRPVATTTEVNISQPAAQGGSDLSVPAAPKPIDVATERMQQAQNVGMPEQVTPAAPIARVNSEVGAGIPPNPANLRNNIPNVQPPPTSQPNATSLLPPMGRMGARPPAASVPPAAPSTPPVIPPFAPQAPGEKSDPATAYQSKITRKQGAAIDGVQFEKAAPVNDITREPTGWKRADYNDGTVIYNPQTHEIIQFEAQNKRSGSDVQRARAEAQDYATNNPVEWKSSPAGEMEIKPVFTPKSAPTPTIHDILHPTAGQPAISPAPAKRGETQRGETAGAVPTIHDVLNPPAVAPQSPAPSSAKESDLTDAGWNKKDLATYTHADGRTLRREGGKWVLSGEKMRGGKLRKPKKYATLKDAIADLAPNAKPAQTATPAESPIQPAATPAPQPKETAPVEPPQVSSKPASEPTPKTPKETTPAKAAPASPTAKHVDLFERVEKGEVTAAEFKAAFDELIASKDAIKAELSALTKDGIFDKFPNLRWRYKNDKKSEVVDAAYGDMLSDFSLSNSVSYVMGQGGYEQAVRNLVAKVTDESLAAHAKKISQARAERQKERDAALEGMKDPQTLEDYTRLLKSKMAEGASYQDARTSLTPEQRATFDELAGAKSRDERRARADQQRTEVRAASQVTTGQVIETKHTKTGEPLFVVKAADRVERDVYNQWNATAKRLGGWYSSFRGAGAVPGFQFKTRDNAEAFLEYLGGKVERAQETAQARRDAMQDDKSQTAVERLREMADSLDEHADEVLSAERQTNTERRARFAANAEAAANADKAMAATMRNIAEAIESGKAKFLDRVRQKVQVEMLQTFARSGYDDYLRAKYPTYAEQEKHRAASPPLEAADYVQFPAYTAFRSDLAKLGRQLSENDGTKKLGVSILKVADDVTDAYLKFAKENLHKVSTFSRKDGKPAVFASKPQAEMAIARSGYKGQAIVLPFKRGENIIILSPSAAREKGIWEGDNDARITLSPEIGDELVEKLKRQRRREFDIPWIFETASERRKRLAAMGLETPAELRAAVREFIGLRKAPKAPDKIKEMERAMVGRRNDGLDFFPTPAGAADEMIATADIQEGMSVLEPSAGMGHIADRIREMGVEPDVVEMASDRRDLLKAKGYNLAGQDFMDVRGHYDRILMNPPFSDRRDVQHVQHAYDLLKPGGRLVAIMGEGSFFGSDKKATAFREWLEKVGGTSEKLEEGTFLDPSLPVNTGVSARMVVIDKSETATSAQPSVEATAAPAEERKASPAPEVIKPTPTEQRTVAKAASNEKIDPNTGFTKSQGEYVASTLKEELPKLQDGQPITVEVPGDGKFTARTPEGANNLYYKLTGKPLISGQRPTVARPVAGGRSDGARKVESMMRSSSERSSGLPADVGEDARGVFPIEMASTTGGWAGNISPTPEFVTDGHAMILASAIGKKSTLLSKTVDDGDEAGKARRTPARIQETWNNAVKAAQKTGTIEGAFMTGTHAGIYAVVTAPRMDAPLVASAAKFKTILDSTEADEVRVKDAASPVVFYKGGQPVAILMPFKLDEKTVVPLNAMRAAVSGKTLKGQEPEFALRQDAAPVFFSQLERTIEEKMPAKASARQVRAIIQSPQNGVKPDEVKWSGLDDYLNAVESLTKEDVLKWIRANRVDVQEVEKGRPELSRKRRDEMQVEANIAHARGDYERSRQIYSQINKLTPQETKFSEYVLPGAKEGSYRELLLTMPNDARTSDGYKSSHFDEPNILAHIRFNERTDSEGKRVLHVEEIQSDWHQEGRKKGYKREVQYTIEEKPAGSTKVYWIRDEAGNHLETRMSRSEAEKTIQTLKEGANFRKVPDAPFKKNWHELAFKRMLRYAAENGYDKLTWTTGEQQGDRYSEDNGGPKDQARTQGMRGFYDQILPAFASKYAKKWGAKVESAELGRSLNVIKSNIGDGYEVFENGKPAILELFQTRQEAQEAARKLGQGQSVHSISITPAMRESVMQGQPQFAKTTAPKGWEEAGGLVQPERVAHRWNVAPINEQTATMDELLDGMRSRIVPPTRDRHLPMLHGNRATTVILSQAMTEMYGRHLDIKGVNLAHVHAAELSRRLTMIAQLLASRKDAQRASNIYELIGRIQLAQKKATALEYDSIQYVDADDTRSDDLVARTEQHETAHAEQRKIGGQAQIVSDEWAKNDKDFQQLSKALSTYGGSPRDVAVEAIAHILSGDRELMGYTGTRGLDRANDFVDRYMAEVAHQHGVWAVKQFRYIRPEFRKTIKEVAERHEQRGQRENGEYGNGRDSTMGNSLRPATAQREGITGPIQSVQGIRGQDSGTRPLSQEGSRSVGGRLPEGGPTGSQGSDQTALARRGETLPDFSQRDFWGVGEAKSAVETFGKWSRESLRDVRSVVNPMGRGLSGEQTASITRERAAEMARKGDQADEKLKDARKILGKLPEMNRRAFVYAIETGTTDQLPAQFQPFAATTRELLDGRRDEVQSLGTGKLQSFYENYFPHIWKDPEKANQVFMSYFAKRPFEGSKSFLKQRTVPTTEHGIALGLKPVSTNPVDLVMLKLREMDRYIMAHRIMDEMKDKGLLSRIKATHRVPPGYAKLDDKVSTIYGAPTEKGTIKIRGYWIAPEAAANVVNNYLSPGLRKFALFRGYLWLANVMNQFQLGISFFHFGFTSLDAAISKAALAMQQLAYGRPLQAAKSAVQVPVAPITTILKGRKMYKAWMDPGSMGPEWDEIAAAGQAGGARVRQDQLYATQMTKKMVEAFRKKNLPGVAGGLFRMPFAAIEQIARPLMEYLVPRQKLGVFAELARLELERLGPNATREDVRKTMAKVWDSVDNRMGQLVYDNLFWDKTFKDVLMASVRSVGWNLGTKREVIGGVSDFVKFGTNVLARIGGRGGGKIPPGGTPPTSYKSGGDWFSGKPEFTYRMGYVIAMPIVVGLVGAMLNYLLTGERPKGLEDCYFPRTGSFDENGKPNRISLPSYMKDIYHYMVDPKKTVVNKLHPALNTVAETLSNKDFYGTEVYNPDDPPYEVAKDVLKHIGASFEPFAIRGLREDKARQTGAPDWFPFIGLTPAPKSLNQSKAERLMDELNAEHRPMGSRTKEQAAQGRLKADIVRTVRRGGEEEGRKMAQDAIDAGKLSGAQLPQIERRAHTPGIVWSFTSLSLSDSLKVWDVATEEEKQALRPALQKKMQSLGRMPEEERNRLLPKARAALGNAP